MEIFPTKKGIQQVVHKHRCSNNTIGLVPTMGALHKGHLALVEKAKFYSDVTVASIFINPTQFNNKSDFEKYPRTLDEDLGLLEKAKVDYVFLPTEKEIYPEETHIKMHFSELESRLEGEYRPGHFNGVGIIVSKLFHIVHPTHVFFGQKDLQQVAIIRRLVKDLSFDLEMMVIPTVRENDGLAMSSRNALLNQGQRKAATLLYQSLILAKDELLKGGKWVEVKEKIQKMFSGEPSARLEYFELVKTASMEIIMEIDKEGASSLCIAAYIGEVRLIDNLAVQ